MKLKRILLGAVLLCNCQMANSAVAVSRTKVSSQDNNSNHLLAQITPDSSLGDESSTVVPDTEVQGVPADLIEGGAERGANLFHSFEEFSIGDGQSAYFANPEGIANILSRVTGNDVSEIMGTLGVDGGADLFLINPNGIIFGENASLDVNGSFTASTADSILFNNDEFSASDPGEPPLLTVNMPVGLNLGNNPGSIVNRSTVSEGEANPVGLSVLAGNNLSFVGGEIEFEGGQATAPRGKIELGGLSTAGIVSILEDGGLTFPEDTAKADITLDDGAAIDVTSAGGGDITANAKNLSSSENSRLSAGIAADSTSTDAQAGDIVLNITDNLILNESGIFNQVAEDGAGNSGDINITAGSIEGRNGGRINASTSGQGYAGLVNITATENIIFSGASLEGDRSGVTSRVNEDGEGNAEGVNISTTNLTLINGGRIDSSTDGDGNAGLVDIIATGDITFDGATEEGDLSEAVSRVNSTGEGNSGGVNISTTNLTLNNGGRVRASTKGRGNAGLVDITATGDIIFDGATEEGDRSEAVSRVDSDGEGNAEGVNISTTNLTLINGGRIDSSTDGKGNAGLVDITATGDITFDGATEEGDFSEAVSRVNSSGEGNSGGVNISTTNLTLSNGGRVRASTKGRGNAGLVDITATGDIIFDGATEEGDRSEAVSRVDSDGEGNAEGVNISSTNLTLINGGRIDASTSGQGDAGFVNITATEDITFNGTTSEGGSSGSSGVSSRVNMDAEGDAGDITISATNLYLANGGRVDTASIREAGDGGSIEIATTEDLILFNNGLISAESSGENDGGNIDISARFIIASPLNSKNIPFDIEQEQEINFTTDPLLQFGNDIIASAEKGQGGNIDIDAKSLFGIEERPLNNETNDISASSEFGLSGTVAIDILEVDPSRDSLNVSVAPVETKVAQICDRDSNINKSELVVTGRGGLPDSPAANLDGGFVLEDWRIDEASPLKRSLSTPSVPDTETNKPIIEADSWQVNKQGKVVLVAANNHSQSSNITPSAANCSAN